MLLRILNLVGALALPKLVDSASCFLPDGSINATDVPCIGNDGTSRCCAPDELCSSNKLCVSKEDHNKFSRGSCLDRSYGSTCPNFCKGINDSGKVTVLPCGSPSLGEFCCDNGNGFQCCAAQSSILKIGVGTSFSEPSVNFTSMSTNPDSAVAATTSIETTSSQVSTDVQTSTTIASSNAAPTPNLGPVTTTFSQIPTVSSSAEISSFLEASSVQSQPTIESQPVPSSSTTEAAETTLAPPAQTSAAAAPSSGAIQTQPSAESQIPSSTFIEPFPSTTLIPSPSTPTSVSQALSFIQPPSLSSPLSVPSAVPVTHSLDPSSPLASQRVSRISSPTQLTSSIRSSNLAIVPQSVSVSGSTAPTSSAATSLIAGADDSDSSDSRKGIPAAIVAGASVASVLAVTSLILGIFFYRKRKAKRLSKNFEASLGRTNIVNEKGSISSGKTGHLGRAEGNLSSPTVNSPANPAPGGAENAWRPTRPPRPEMAKSQASSTFGRLLYDVSSKPI
ncbi:hypothetical protein BGZ57DRAFT_306652 [Hyaloscypha finlandica]|nr:hypothetical protein BGZ57DRAFT_306652 [Hyaloscypha finlandica]